MFNFWPFNRKKKELKLCINCKYCVSGEGCSRHMSNKVNLIDGQVRPVGGMVYCVTERYAWFPFGCGKRGHYFVDKRPFK